MKYSFRMHENTHHDGFYETAIEWHKTCIHVERWQNQDTEKIRALSSIIYVVKPTRQWKWAEEYVW